MKAGRREALKRARQGQYFTTYERLNVHVYATSREVIKAALGKLACKRCRDNPATWQKEREARKNFYAMMLYHHAQARKLVERFRL